MAQIEKKDTQYQASIEKKDEQNQANLNRFIGLVEKTNEFMSKQIQAIEGVHPKLNEMHEDIKALRK